LILNMYCRAEKNSFPGIGKMHLLHDEERWAL
jgi:hypothetical protein